MAYSVVGGLVTWGGSRRLSVFFGESWDCLAVCYPEHLHGWIVFCWRHEVALFLWRNQRKTVKDSGSGHLRPFSSWNNKGWEQQLDQKLTLQLVSLAHKCSMQTRAYPAVPSWAGQQQSCEHTVLFVLSSNKGKVRLLTMPCCVLSH